MIPVIILFCALWDYSYNCTVTFTYDNNIFAYSQEYIDDFMNQVRPYRFPFETYDDLYTEPDIDFRIRNKLIGDYTTTFNIGLRVRHYTINQQKDFQRLVAGVRQSFGSWAIKGSYRIIPEYLIRYYRDPQGPSSSYIACEVAYHTITGKVSLPDVAMVRPEVLYQYSVDNYVQAFDMYDARAHAIGIRNTIALSKTFVAELSYDFKTSFLDTTIKGENSSNEPIPDGAYFQQKIAGDIYIEGVARLPLVVSLGYRYAFRNHRTDQSDDRMHFGRQDHLHTITFATDMKIRTGLLFSINYTHMVRNATSQIFPDINLIKDYIKDRISAGVMVYY